jgi:hypothetical protein
MQSLEQNLAAYFLMPVQIFFGAPCPWIFFVTSLALVVIGLRSAWEKTPHVVFYCVATLVLLVVWPFYQGVRLVLPVLPFFFLFVLEGIESLCSGMGARWARVARSLTIAVSSILLVSLFIAAAAGVRKNLETGGIPEEGPFSKDAQEMFHFVSTQTTTDDVIVFFKPRLMQLLTGRRSFESSTRAAIEQADYICLFDGFVEENGGMQLPHILFNDLVKEGRIQPVFVNPKFVIGKTSRSLR